MDRVLEEASRPRPWSRRPARSSGTCPGSGCTGRPAARRPCGRPARGSARSSRTMVKAGERRRTSPTWLVTPASWTTAVSRRSASGQVGGQRLLAEHGLAPFDRVDARRRGGPRSRCRRTRRRPASHDLLGRRRTTVAPPPSRRRPAARSGSGSWTATTSVSTRRQLEHQEVEPGDVPGPDEPDPDRCHQVFWAVMPPSTREHRAVDERGAGQDQRPDGVGHLGRARRSARRAPAGGRRCPWRRRGSPPVMPVRIGPGQTALTVTPERPELHGQAPGQADDAVLAGGVGRDERRGPEGLAGGHVDDAARRRSGGGRRRRPGPGGRGR